MTSILVIEDEVSVRKRIADVLRREGHQVFEAEDGLAGVDLARELAPQLIICDIAMPRLNGIAVLCVLRDELPDLGSRMVMLTAAEEPSSRRLVLDLGAHGCLEKPIQTAQLLAAVRGQVSHPGKRRRPAIPLAV